MAQAQDLAQEIVFGVRQLDALANLAMTKQRSQNDRSHAYRKGFYDEAVKVIGPFVRRFRLADVLYRDYRSLSIHEFPFDADEQFFEERDSTLQRVTARGIPRASLSCPFRRVG